MIWCLCRISAWVTERGTPMFTQAAISIFVFALVLVGFAVNILPMEATAMLGMMVLVFLGCLDASSAASIFSSSTVLMLAPMFLIAAAFSKTQAIQRLSDLVVRVSKGSARAVVAGYVLLSLVLVQLINSASAVFFIVYPLVLACCKEMGISPSKTIFPVGLSCMATAGVLPTASAISMCEVWRGYFTAYGLTQFDYGVLDYCLSRIPMAICVVLFAIFYAPGHLPERVPSTAPDLMAGEKPIMVQPSLTRFQEGLTVAVFLGMIIGVSFSRQLGVPSWQVCMLGAVLLVAAGVMRWKEIPNSIGLGVLLLYVGGTGIATALQQSGAVEIIGDWMLRLFGSHPNQYLFGLAFFLISYLLTQVLSNSAVSFIFVPICLMSCAALGCNPVGPMFCSLCGSSTGFLTPMANPTAPVVFEMGGYQVKDILKITPVFSVPAAVLSTLWIMTLFPMYG